jgi:hypothetical protein
MDKYLLRPFTRPNCSVPFRHRTQEFYKDLKNIEEDWQYFPSFTEPLRQNNSSLSRPVPGNARYSPSHQWPALASTMEDSKQGKKLYAAPARALTHKILTLAAATVNTAAATICPPRQHASTGSRSGRNRNRRKSLGASLRFQDPPMPTPTSSVSIPTMLSSSYEGYNEYHYITYTINKPGHIV